MPVTNGVEFLRRVRERYPDLPFVPFTGEGSEDIASDATRGLVTAESVESVAERTVEATREVLARPAGSGNSSSRRDSSSASSRCY